MIDWKLDAETQAKYDRVVLHIRRLQAELGIKSRTIEERARDYELAKQEKKLKEQELVKLTNRRPPPKWKV